MPATSTISIGAPDVVKHVFTAAEIHRLPRTREHGIGHEHLSLLIHVGRAFGRRKLVSYDPHDAYDPHEPHFFGFGRVE